MNHATPPPSDRSLERPPLRVATRPPRLTPTPLLGTVVALLATAPPVAGPLPVPTPLRGTLPPLGLLLLLVLPPLVALYRRLTRREVLDQGTRVKVLRAVRDRPGATLGRLSDHLQLDYKTVVHHVRVLREFGLVQLRRDGRLRRAYAAGEAPPKLGDRLRGTPATALQVLQLVVQRPGITQAACARRLGLARSTVNWHVGRLVADGLLAPPGGAPGLFLAEDAGWVREVLPTSLAGHGDRGHAS